MAVMLSKAKLIAALQKRSKELEEIAKRRQTKYEAAMAEYKERCVENAQRFLKRLQAAKTTKAAYRLMECCGNELYVQYPQKPRKPNSAGLTRALAELELLDDETLTVESHRSYLEILTGSEDYYDDPDEDAEEEED